MGIEGTNVERPAPAVGQRWVILSTWVVVAPGGDGGWMVKNEAAVDAPAQRLPAGWFDYAQFIGWKDGYGPTVAAMPATGGPMGEDSSGLPLRCLFCGVTSAISYGCQACAIRTPLSVYREVVAAWRAGARDFPRHPAAPAPGAILHVTAPVVEPASQHDFSDPYAVIVAHALDGGKIVSRVCRHCGDSVNDDPCEPKDWRDADEANTAVLTRNIDRVRVAPALFPASSPPAPFQQSHSLTCGGVFSLRDEGAVAMRAK